MTFVVLLSFFCFSLNLFWFHLFFKRLDRFEFFSSKNPSSVCFSELLLSFLKPFPNCPKHKQSDACRNEVNKFAGRPAELWDVASMFHQSVSFSTQESWVCFCFFRESFCWGKVDGLISTCDLFGGFVKKNSGKIIYKKEPPQSPFLSVFPLNYLEIFHYLLAAVNFCSSHRRRCKLYIFWHPNGHLSKLAVTSLSA